MLALIKDNHVLNRIEFIGQFAEGGWVDLPDGSRASPAVNGWRWNEYELKTILPADLVPEGQRIVGTNIELFDGIPKYVNILEPNAPNTETVSPSLFAAASIKIENGQATMMEIVAQLQGAVYEDGWLMVFFSQEQEESQYMIFAQTDIPTKIEQFKSSVSFELVFSDLEGNPINPNQIDIQILKVR